MAKTGKILEKMAQLDIDAWHAYGKAIDKIDEVMIRERLTEFREDHRLHVEKISEMMKQMGLEPPEFSRDFKGYLIEGMTTLQSSTGTEGALKAMETNEKLTNRKYKEAVDQELPADVRTLLQENYEDEKRHLSYVQEKLGK